MNSRKILIVGAGPGGLTAGMILSNWGYQVEIYEKNESVGGRNSRIDLGGFKFDMGPTFLMMKDILEEVFNLAGKDVNEALDIMEVDPMYRLFFNENQIFYPTRHQEKMINEIERLFPGESKYYLKYLDKERKKYDKLVPCLQIPYGSFFDFLKLRFFSSLPYLDAHLSLYDVLGRYFNEELLKLAFTFQAKYIGMSPWEAPGTFSIISYIEHGGGIFHVKGGLNQISRAMAKVIKENGGKIHFNRPVERVHVEAGRAKGLKLANGDTVEGDGVVINADFAYAMSKLVDSRFREKYSDEKLKEKKYSCSTFMIYLGLDKIYDTIPHHNIIFSGDYKKNVDEITYSKVLSDDPSFYIQNPSLIDKSLAPDGKSTIYVLVPVPNNKSSIDWEKEKKNFRDKIMKKAAREGGLEDIENHIEVEKVLTPKNWEEDMNVYLGATFNLGHQMKQMLYFRPHNRFEEIENCYLVGGGTHPGSGLPTIYESGRISASLIRDDIK